MKALRIMVVEDEVVIAMLLEEILADMGHEVCAVESTEANAVLAARRSKPDLMIVDFRLAEGSGIAAIAQILRTGFVPNVLISADVPKRAVLNPGTVVMHKPFRESDLVLAMQRALDAAPVV